LVRKAVAHAPHRAAASFHRHAVMMPAAPPSFVVRAAPVAVLPPIVALAERILATVHAPAELVLRAGAILRRSALIAIVKVSVLREACLRGCDTDERRCER